MAAARVDDTLSEWGYHPIKRSLMITMSGDARVNAAPSVRKKMKEV
jgi:hypothetical protein